MEMTERESPERDRERRKTNTAQQMKIIIIKMPRTTKQSLFVWFHIRNCTWDDK